MKKLIVFGCICTLYGCTSIPATVDDTTKVADQAQRALALCGKGKVETVSTTNFTCFKNQ